MTISVGAQLVRMAHNEGREACAQIVRQEWRSAVSEFGLQPGTPTETVIARILERINALYRADSTHEGLKP